MELKPREKLDLYFIALLEKNNPEFTYTSAFIQRTLKLFHLDKFYEVSDVLAETYIRAVYYIEYEDREDIRNLPAWIRSTAYNIIREFSRKQQKYQSLDEVRNNQHSLALANFSNSLALESNLEQEIKILRTALKNLEEDEQKLIRLRVVEGLSWNEIAKLLAFEERKVINSSTLRQRGSRSLKKLRKIYYSLITENIKDLDLTG